MNIITQHNQPNVCYLMLCELHYPAIHGKDGHSDPNIETHFIVYDRFDPITGVSFQSLGDYENYETDNEHISDDENHDNNQNSIIKINNTIGFLKQYYSNPKKFNPQHVGNHPTIRNYHNIISRPNYIKPEIGEYIILPTQEAIAILKTVWIRIIQRKWKNVFAERQNVINQRKYLYNLRFIEYNGKWPQICSILPGLKGMLKELKK